MIGTKVLEERSSKFNGNLRVVKTLGMGTYIQSDGLTQSGGIVETIWRQTIHKVGKKIKTVDSCLILGLGGGTVAGLIRKKYPKVKITGVEIDPIMVELGEKYLGLDKIGVSVKIADACKFLIKGQNSSLMEKYDLVIVDLYNGDQFPKEFEESSYIELIRGVVSDCGVVVFNRLYFGDKRPMAVKFGRKLEKMFSKVIWFYPEANLMFLCSK